MTRHRVGDVRNTFGGVFFALAFAFVLYVAVGAAVIWQAQQ